MNKFSKEIQIALVVISAVCLSQVLFMPMAIV